MNRIEKPGELIAASVRAGVQMTELEAIVVLGYLEGHDFCLMTDDSFAMKLHDNQDGEKTESDEPYTIRDVAEFCCEMNDEMLLEENTSESPDEDRRLELMKDEAILSLLRQKVETFVPPVIREYEVLIVEHLKMKVPVLAASWAEAKEKAEAAWKEGDYVLDASHFAGVSFTMGG